MYKALWRQIGIPTLYVFVVGVVALFIHTGLQGEHGLAAQREAERTEMRLAAELAALRAERAALAEKVRRISEGYLDLELLDQQARTVLGLARPDELVIH
ncbi:MAG: septum formation initiator family protein [Pseudomonadota bacterium]